MESVCPRSALFSGRVSPRKQAPTAAAGELLVQPQSETEQERLGIASLVLEQGLGGLSVESAPVRCVVVPLGPSSPTLDDMLAASIVSRLTVAVKASRAE